MDDTSQKKLINLVKYLTFFNKVKVKNEVYSLQTILQKGFSVINYDSCGFAIKFHSLSKVGTQQ